MSVHFEIAHRMPDTPPSAEDAARVGQMRRIAAARLRYCGLHDLITDVMLVVSELLTNAIVHSGGTTIGFLMRVGAGVLHISVIDGALGQATRQEPSADAESGRGLLLVDALVRDNGGTWGTSASGAVTWCEFALPAEAGR
jgi:anti-sigma regulatory factor (Ser/Thr protein kinase)